MSARPQGGEESYPLHSSPARVVPVHLCTLEAAGCSDVLRVPHRRQLSLRRAVGSESDSELNQCWLVHPSGRRLAALCTEDPTPCIWNGSRRAGPFLAWPSDSSGPRPVHCEI